MSEIFNNNVRIVQSTYKSEDVTILLKDLTGLIKPMTAEEREAAIQSGVHYSSMLPQEKEPTAEYAALFEQMLKDNAEKTAQAVMELSCKICNSVTADEITLVSLARAGISAGVLIKRFLGLWKPELKVNHYAISIIRGIGIDKNAMNYILNRHSAESVCFIDGWTGKGAILNTLTAALSEDYPCLVANDKVKLGVLADPAHVTELYGTQEDFIIPNSCLNSTVLGLISRTILREDLVDTEAGEFHGAVYFGQFEGIDRTYKFIESVENCFDIEFPNDSGYATVDSDSKSDYSFVTGLEEVQIVKEYFGISDINFVKPGIGETTRVLLRRIPWKILVNDLSDTCGLEHILCLAKEKNVEVVEYPLKCYRVCGIIKDLADA